MVLAERWAYPTLKEVELSWPSSSLVMAGLSARTLPGHPCTPDRGRRLSLSGRD